MAKPRQSRAKAKPSKGGRPRKTVNPELVHQLAAIGCTMQEIADQCDCSIDTLERRFAGVIEKGKLFRNASLRRHMFSAALKGSVAMQIWLSKQYLGMADKAENKTEVDLTEGSAKRELLERLNLL